MRIKLKPSHILLIGICLLLIPSIIFADGFGSIKGKVINEKTREPISFISVAIRQNGEIINGAATGFGGAYVISNIPEGRYTVEFSQVGYETRILKRVKVQASKTTILKDMELKYAVLGYWPSMSPLPVKPQPQPFYYPAFSVSHGDLQRLPI